MERKIWLRVIGCFLYFPALLLSGCMKDKVTKTYTINTPIYETLTKFREQIKSLPSLPITTTGRMTLAGHYIFLSEPNKGIHVIDNSNPAAPKNISFINIPGNVEIAVKGNTLYADSYGDLVTLDITDPTEVIVRDFESNVFPQHSIYYAGSYSIRTYNSDSINVIIGYTSKDTTIDYNEGNVYPIYFANCPNCSVAPAMAGTANAANVGNAVGTNGSMAGFAIIGNYLYAVGSFNLSAFDISQPAKPAFTNTEQVDFHVETIFQFKDKLFVGTNDGMYMYDVQTSASSPSFVGKFTHLRGCDPVITDGNYAYITLNDSSACLGFDNQLQIVDITDMTNSFQVKAYQLVHPVGLSKDGNILFICDSRDGLKIYNASDVINLQLIKQLKDATVYDVIAENGLAIVMGADGIYQYDYSDLNNIHLVSKL